MSNIEQQEPIENVLVIPQLTVSEKGTPMASSLDVAKVFGKEHKNVLQSIENLFEDIPQDFNELNFQLVEYIDAKGEKRPMYNLTRDAFTLLAMGFTGKKAMQFKIAYIEAFNAMEKSLMKYKNKEQKTKYLELEPRDKSIPMPPAFTSLLSEKGLKGIKGLIQFIAFLNSTTYEEIEKYCLKTLGISSLKECNDYMGNTLINLLNFYQSNMFFFEAQNDCSKLETYKNTFYGLMDYWEIFRKDITREYIEFYLCKISDLQKIEQIQTKEQYIKGIFAIYKAIVEEKK